MVQTAFGVTAALLAIALGLNTFERYLAKRRLHELAWTIAFASFAIASFALALGAQHGFNGLTFRTFFLFGAIVNVPVLALGSLMLATRNRQSAQRNSVIIVATFCAFSTGVMVSTPFINPLPVTGLPQGSDVFGALPRILAAVGSGVSALVIIVVAIQSALRRYSRNIVLGNSLIALGTLITGMSGLLNSVMGQMTAFAITLALGIAVIFAGFLVVTNATATKGSPKTV